MEYLFKGLKHPHIPQLLCLGKISKGIRKDLSFIQRWSNMVKYRVFMVSELKRKSGF